MQFLGNKIPSFIRYKWTPWWNPSAGRYSVGWWHSAGDLFDSTSSDCREYVTDDDTVPVATGNPFIHATPLDQSLACQGIASRTSSNCTGISDGNDRQMCSALAMKSQSPCGTISDRNLQLACYGMSVAPNYPSNCRNITDAQMRAFCYGVSSGGSMPDCASVTHADTRALCHGMALRNTSYCTSITNANDRQFCYGVASSNSTYCASIN